MNPITYYIKQALADGFYMTLTVQSPNASGTRTVQSNEYNAFCGYRWIMVYSYIP